MCGILRIEYLILNLISFLKMNLNVTTAITALTNRGRSRHTLGDSVDCQEKYMGPVGAREVPKGPYEL